jgi:Xaa-Pro aminopeptidase
MPEPVLLREIYIMVLERKEAYQRHRANFFDKLPKNSIAIIANPPAKIRNEDVEYSYRSNSHFQYLTNFPEAETVAVFSKLNDSCKYYLFCLPKDLSKESWTGKRIGTLAARKYYGADEAYDLDQLPLKISEWLKKPRPTLWMLHEELDGQSQPVEIYERLKKKCAKAKVTFPKANQIQDLTPALMALRDTKDSYELQELRNAAMASMFGHLSAWQILSPGVTETHLYVKLIRAFLLYANPHGLAYPCVVAGANRANTLHYQANDQLLEDGELVLIDAAAETKEGYASDITRTAPVNGKFSAAQAKVYQQVLNIQKELIAMCVPGTNFYDIQDRMVRLATKALDFNCGVAQRN